MKTRVTIHCSDGSEPLVAGAMTRTEVDDLVRSIRAAHPDGLITISAPDATLHLMRRNIAWISEVPL